MDHLDQCCFHSAPFTPGCPACEERRKNEVHVRGILLLYVDQGGGGYSIQDEKYIDGEQWSMLGLVPIKDGDFITAYNQDGSVYWEGRVYLDSRGRPKLAKTWWEQFKNLFIAHPLPTQKEWGNMFMREMRGRLFRNG